MITTRLAAPAELDATAEVWRLANIARGKVPSQQRIARVHAKLTGHDALVVVAVDSGALVGMALAEPGLADDGAGSPLAGLCHVSMVFVHPERWGKAIGQQLLTAVASYAGRDGYAVLQLWTGESNERAQRLYRRAGFSPTGRTKQLDTGELVLHLTRPITTSAVPAGARQPGEEPALG
ncbi:MAG TPA: GNAT family N-acetyltransferase [Kribbella sp.]|nr:GNAT family N-acetyltransferase [Kribbella sp.]